MCRGDFFSYRCRDILPTLWKHQEKKLKQEKPFCLWELDGLLSHCVSRVFGPRWSSQSGTALRTLAWPSLPHARMDCLILGSGSVEISKLEIRWVCLSICSLERLFHLLPSVDVWSWAIKHSFAHFPLLSSWWYRNPQRVALLEVVLGRSVQGELWGKREYRHLVYST